MSNVVLLFSHTMRYSLALLVNTIIAFTSIIMIMFVGILTPAIGMLFYVGFQSAGVAGNGDMAWIIFCIVMLIVYGVFVKLLIVINGSLYESLFKKVSGIKILFIICAAMPHAMVMIYMISENWNYIVG